MLFRSVFRGAVSQVRLNPQTTQNVVTYTAVIDVHNPELKLRPGMTANVTATVAESLGVVKIPNAALRFRPERRESAATPRDAAPAGARRGQVVWKLEGKDQLRPVPVSLGITDGVHTALLSGDLKPGDAVATGQSGADDRERPAARNPMMPFSGRGGRR